MNILSILNSLFCICVDYEGEAPAAGSPTQEPGEGEGQEPEQEPEAENEGIMLLPWLLPNIGLLHDKQGAVSILNADVKWVMGNAPTVAFEVWCDVTALKIKKENF